MDYRGSDLIGKKLNEIFPKVFSLIVDGAILKVLAGQPSSFEAVQILQDSSEVIWDAVLSPIRDKSGRVTRFVGIFSDITKRRLAEQSLLESEEILRSVIDNIAVGVALISPKMEILMLNGQMLQWFPRIDASKKPICYGAFNVPPREAVCGYCPTCKTLVDGNVHESITESPAGEEINNYRVRSSPIRDKDGNITAAVEVVEDITERYRAEEALRKSEKKYKDLFDSTLDGIYQMDADGVFILMNPAGAKMLGHESPYEIIGRKGLEYWRDPGDRDAFRAELKISKSVSGYHMRLKKKNGEPIELETSSTIKEDEKGAFLGMEGILRDVTELKKLADQLRHSQKMEAISSLAGGIAHDFNNILQVIMGYGTMVLDKLEPDSPSKGQMNEVLAAAGRAANLTKRLLAFSRKQPTDVKPTNVNELITDIQKMLVRLVRESIDFKLDLADTLLVVMADAGQIEQVLVNLVSNANDAMPNGGRLLIGTGLQEIDDEYIAINGYGKTGMYALITVSDTGHGIDAETQKMIFEPFFTTKGIGVGTGLGLAISYGIIKQHNGYTKVYSEPGQGTVFKLYLPLTEKPAALEVKTAAADAFRGGNETVLVAEDDASLKELIKMVLEPFGYSVITAENGEDAITKFMENRDRVPLVMLDVIMPKKNGKEVSEVIRKASPDVKIIFLSGYTMDIIKDEYLTESDFDFIHKPIRPQDLLIKVREVLDK